MRGCDALTAFAVVALPAAVADVGTVASSASGDRGEIAAPAAPAGPLMFRVTGGADGALRGDGLGRSLSAAVDAGVQGPLGAGWAHGFAVAPAVLDRPQPAALAALPMRSRFFAVAGAAQPFLTEAEDRHTASPVPRAHPDRAASVVALVAHPTLRALMGKEDPPPAPRAGRRSHGVTVRGQHLGKADKSQRTRRIRRQEPLRVLDQVRHDLPGRTGRIRARFSQQVVGGGQRQSGETFHQPLPQPLFDLRSTDRTSRRRPGHELG